MNLKPKFDSEINEFISHLEELMFITKNLKRVSSMILLMMLVSVFIFIIFAIGKRIVFYNDRYYNDYFVFMLCGISFVVTFAAIGVFLLIRFNELRKRGMILYDELTDEIDWSNKRKEFMYKRPPMEMRIVIKEFIVNSDLPFTSGPNGLAFYLGVLLSLVLATILLFTL